MGGMLSLCHPGHRESMRMEEGTKDREKKKSAGHFMGVEKHTSTGLCRSLQRVRPTMVRCQATPGLALQNNTNTLVYTRMQLFS